MTQLRSELFKKIRNIQIQTTKLSNDILAGAWRSAFKGRGMEFEEVREYQEGDDIRSIDWNVTARMNHPYVKVFGEERELTVMLVVDVSASSRFGSHNQLKKDLIAEIGGVLAFSAIKNNDKIGLILFSEEVEKYIPPKKGTRHVLRVIRELLAFQPKKQGTNLKNALDFTGGILQKTAICFLISDFICPLPQKPLSLISSHHDFISIKVTDPYELELPKMELVHFFDLESGEERIIDTSDKKIQKTFENRGKKRTQAIDQMMKKIGAGFIHIQTDQPYIAPMQKFFKTRGMR